jgi:hypothetical protein
MLRCRHPCSLLRELRLSHCYLGRNGFNSQAFHRLPSLEILDLSENFLNTIPPAARLPTVRVGPLKKLPYVISSIVVLASLLLIFIAYNQLMVFPYVALTPY